MISKRKTERLINQGCWYKMSNVISFSFCENRSSCTADVGSLKLSGKLTLSSCKQFWWHISFDQGQTQNEFQSLLVA